MDLKDFVKESLVQISKGIEEANSELEGTGAMVNPIHAVPLSNTIQGCARTTNRSAKAPKNIEKVNFDVAVVAEAGEQAKAGLKLSIASIGFGADGQTSSSDRSESRIQFSIPMVLPGYDNDN